MTYQVGTGSIGGRQVRFSPVHREFNDTAPVLTLTMSVPVSYEDMTAALWVAVHGGMSLDEVLADVHTVIVEDLFNDSGAVDAARLEIAELALGTPEWEQLIQLQLAVLRTYGPAPDAARRPEFARLVGPTAHSSAVLPGHELRRMRQERGLSLRQLAKLIPCDPGTLSRIESGKRQAGAGIAAAASKLLATTNRAGMAGAVA